MFWFFVVGIQYLYCIDCLFFPLILRMILYKLATARIWMLLKARISDWNRILGLGTFYKDRINTSNVTIQFYKPSLAPDFATLQCFPSNDCISVSLFTYISITLLCLLCH